MTKPGSRLNASVPLALLLPLLAAGCATPTASKEPDASRDPASPTADGINRVAIALSPADYDSIWKPQLRVGVQGYLGKEFIFDPASARVNVQGQPLNLKKLSLRGLTCKKAARKCVSVNSRKSEAPLGFVGVNPVKSSDFNLISMWQDEGYISNKLCYGLLNATGLIRLKSNYAWLKVFHPEPGSALGLTQRHEDMGLYLVTEKPDEVIEDKLGSPFLLRRGTNDKYEVKHLAAGNPVAAGFERKYLELYHWARTLRGQALYDRVAERLDLDSYFAWLTFNTLVRNQDYQDEVFLYADAAEAAKGRLLLHPFPWDFDDVFQNAQTGLLANFKKIVTRPDSLDKAIAREPLFQAKYRQVARDFLARLDDRLVDQVAGEVYRDIGPYLQEGILGVSSALDGKARPHNPAYIQSLLRARVAEVKGRRAQLLRE